MLVGEPKSLIWAVLGHCSWWALSYYGAGSALYGCVHASARTCVVMCSYLHQRVVPALDSLHRNEIYLIVQKHVSIYMERQGNLSHWLHFKARGFWQ